MIWKKIKNYNYHVCENGDIKNLKTNKLLKGTIKGGYNMIALYDKNGNKKNMRRHIVVANLFCDRIDISYNVVNHIDGNKLNNNYKNLEWTTNRLNTQHAAKLGLLKPVNQRKVQRICSKSGDIKIYNSLIEACKDETSNNITVIDICNVCSGRQKTARGYYWVYLEEDKKEDYIPSNGIEIKDFESYLITPDGNIYSKKSQRYLKPSLNEQGYLVIDLFKDNYSDDIDESKYTRKRASKRKKFKLHYLVAKHFLENLDPDILTEVDHLDKNKSNNNISNLEWVSKKENLQRAHNKSIIQLNMENEFIKLYESLNQAGEYLSLKPSNISRALVKNKPHGGYIWNYINSDKYTKITTFENEIIYIHPKYSFLKFID
jgi:hypothetical protein